MANTQSETINRTELRFPGKYNVVVVNDDYTPMEFVVQILIEIFNKSLEEAQDLTMQVHDNGKAIAGTYNRELSEQKKSESVHASRENGYPLTILVEKID
jgi:ATP-dependent Clp protease adaptor protein ClpS